MVLVHSLPFEPHFHALRLAVIGKALNTSVFNKVMCNKQRIDHVLAIDNPMPAARTPMRIRCPVVHFVRI